MGFEQVLIMMTVKAKEHGLDLTVMEKALGIIPNKRSKTCLLTHQSDINAAKRIKVIK